MPVCTGSDIWETVPPYGNVSQVPQEGLVVHFSGHSRNGRGHGPYGPGLIMVIRPFPRPTSLVVRCYSRIGGLFCHVRPVCGLVDYPGYRIQTVTRMSIHVMFTRRGLYARKRERGVFL